MATSRVGGGGGGVWRWPYTYTAERYTYPYTRALGAAYVYEYVYEYVFEGGVKALSKLIHDVFGSFGGRPSRFRTSPDLLRDGHSSLPGGKFSA